MSRLLRDARELAAAHKQMAALLQRTRALELAAQELCVLIDTARAGDEAMVVEAIARLRAALRGAA